MVVPIVAAGIAWKWIYAEKGLLNYGLSLLKFNQVRIAWLTEPHWTFFTVIAVTMWKGLGFYMVIYLAALQSIPGSLFEAAAIERSDGWSKISVPLMRPYLLLVAVRSSIVVMKVF